MVERQVWPGLDTSFQQLGACVWGGGGQAVLTREPWHPATLAFSLEAA
jgi:hypothetical protein